jgi:Transposase DDE domain
VAGYEYSVLVTSLDAEILTIAQLYRDRADAENPFDELKNHWGWGGFTTQDLKRCRFMAWITALVYSWWSLFVRLADPNQHTEAITSRPLLLYTIGKQTRHAGQTHLTLTSTPKRPRRSLPVAAFRLSSNTFGNCGAVHGTRTLVPDPEFRPGEVPPW